MSAETERPVRRWITWAIIGATWAGTALAVAIASRIHPATIANISLNTKRISFRTSANHIFGPSNEEQLLVSGVGMLRIQFDSLQSITIGGHAAKASSLEIQGGPSTSCSFYQVRSGGLELSGPAIITLDKPNIAENRSFSLQAHGALSSNFSSRPGDAGSKPGFECQEVHVNGGPAVDLEGTFSPKGGDSIFLATSNDPRLDFVTAPHSEVGDTQIPILEGLRFSEIDPGSGEEKSVLLKPPPEIVFETVNRKVTVDDADLLVVVPQTNFYLRRFAIENGIQLSLHGSVQEVKEGPGSSGLETVMPSAFDQLDYEKRIYGGIPSLVALILAVVERMGGLQKR
jgi:hypothetical protein